MKLEIENGELVVTTLKEAEFKTPDCEMIDMLALGSIAESSKWRVQASYSELSALCEHENGQVPRRKDDGDLTTIEEDHSRNVHVLQGILSVVCSNEVDTERYAELLIRRFGTIGSTIHAPESEVRSLGFVDDRIVELFKLLRSTEQKIIDSNIIKKLKFSNLLNVGDILFRKFRYYTNEYLMVFYLDDRYDLIDYEILYEGTIDHVPLYPRELVKRALSFNASHVCLCHNHPSGDPSPSSADVSLTKTIANGLELFGTKLYAHFVVGRDGVVLIDKNGDVSEVQTVGHKAH
jgi:DNA repair protein RadC